MIRSAPAFALTVATMCVALGLACALAWRLAAAGEGELSLLAGVGALAAIVSITLVATAPHEHRAPVGVCALIVAYAFVASFLIPLGDGRAPTHHAGHAHATATP